MKSGQQQIDFDAASLARATDTATSHAAATGYLRSGALKGHEKLIFDGLILWPDRTAAELAKHIALDLSQIDRRVSEMEAKGLIVKGTQRRCRVRERLMNIWRVK